jgi:hypothetical protein
VAGDAYYAPPGHMPLITAGSAIVEFSPAATDTSVAVVRLISFLETGVVPDGLFAPDVFADLSLPHWRIQTNTAQGILAERFAGWPWTGSSSASRRGSRHNVCTQN